MSWRHCTQLVCLLGLLAAPLAAHARFAEQIAASLAEMDESVTIESQTRIETEALFTCFDHAFSIPVDLLPCDLPCQPDPGMLIREVSPTVWRSASIAIRLETASHRHARLQVFRF